MTTVPHQHVAIRGDSPLTQEELRAHLTGLMELPHVAVLLGAGASRCAGGRLVSQMAADLARWIEELPVDEREACLPMLAKPGDVLDIEATWTNVRLILDQPWIPVSNAMRGAAKKLGARLLGDLREAARVDAAKLAHHEQLLQKLLWGREPGQPPRWIFSSNYDLAIELAAERVGAHIVNGFVGLHERRFEPAALDLGLYLRAARGEARFGAPYLCLAKLHGSLSWFTSPNDAVVEISADAASCDARVPVLIPPSRSKYTDTVSFLQGELFRRLAEYVQQPDSVLMVNGYALSDHHINRLLYTGLLNPTFHLVLCYCPSLVSGGKLVAAAFNGGDAQPIPQAVRDMVSRDLPSVTVVSGCKDGPATFEGFTGLLPQPALLDNESRNIERIARELMRVAEKRQGEQPGGAT